MHRNKVLEYLQKGSDCNLFEQAKHSSVRRSGNFVPYERERNHVGQLVQNQDRPVLRQPSKVVFASQHVSSHIYPQISIKSKTEGVESPKFDPVTKYVTLLSQTGDQEYNGSIKLDSYTVKQNQVEKGLQPRKLPQKLDHKYQLIGKQQSMGTPSLGSYDPQIIEKHQPNIQIKSKPLPPVIQEREPYIKDDIILPKIKNDGEMVYARQINAINREVDAQIKKNPNQLLHPNDLNMNHMTLEESQQLSQRMRWHFTTIKDSLNKIKNLINTKK